MRSTSRFALFLVLLVLGQEFSLARYASNEWMLAARQDNEQRENTIDNVYHDYDKDTKADLEYLDQEKSNSEDVLAENDDNEEEDDDEEETGLQVPQKRNAFVVVVLTLQLTSSAAALSAEIYYKINGCCGSHKLVCSYRDEIKAIEKRLGPLSKKADKMAIEAYDLKEDIIQTNYQLNAVWNAMKDIETYEDELVEILVPSVIKQFNLKYNEIKTQLEQKNATVQQYSYDKLNAEYQSVFDKVESTMWAMSTWMGYGMMFATMKAFSIYRNNQVSKMVDSLSTGEGYRQLVNARHTKAAKLMGVNKVGLNTFLKNHATNKVNAKYGGAKLRWTVNGLSAAAAGISIAFDVLAIIAKVEQCNAIEAKLFDGRDKMRNAETKVKEVLTNITNYKSYLQNDGWGYIKNQVTNARVQKAIADINVLVSKSNNKNAALRTAIANMNLFLSTINQTVVTNRNQSWYLVKNLATGLEAVKFKMSCYVNRGRLIRHLLEQCKNGTGSLPDLYNSGIKTFGTHGDNCIIDNKGTPYTKYANVEASVKNMSKAENYSADCILNNKDKLGQACSYKKEGYDATWISNKMKPLTVPQVKYFLDRCPPPELTPKDKKNICSFKAIGWTAKQMLPFLSDGLTEAVVQNHMDNGCP